MLQAERSYKQILELYPKSAKVLRSYGFYVLGVTINPHAAMRYFAEAEELEQQQEEVWLQLRSPSYQPCFAARLCAMLFPWV